MSKIIEDNLFNETVRYLSGRPYVEVVGAIANLATVTDTTALFNGLTAAIRSGKVPSINTFPRSLMGDAAFVDFQSALADKLTPAAPAKPFRSL